MKVAKKLRSLLVAFAIVIIECGVFMDEPHVLHANTERVQLLRTDTM